MGKIMWKLNLMNEYFHGNCLRSFNWLYWALFSNFWPFFQWILLQSRKLAEGLLLEAQNGQRRLLARDLGGLIQPGSIPDQRCDLYCTGKNNFGGKIQNSNLFKYGGKFKLRINCDGNIFGVKFKPNWENFGGKFKFILECKQFGERFKFKFKLEFLKFWREIQTQI